MSEQKQTLTIQNYMKLFNVSYPTALKAARANGRFVKRPPKGIWLFDAAAVRQQIEAEIAANQEQLKQLDALAV